MEKVCHAIINDMGSDNVGKIREEKKKKKRNDEKICPYGTYTGQGP